MKKQTLKKIFYLIVLLSFNLFFGQTLKGKVTSNGKTLSGINIKEKGTKNSTTSDFDGSFILKNVQLKAVIIFSSIGFETRELVFDGNVMNVTMYEEASALNDVVVVGYGSIKKKDLTGSVGSINAKSLRDIPVAGIDQALLGKIAGVNVIQNSGTPGGGVSIRIRGVASLSGNEPLYVVDGVPLQGGDGNDSFNYTSTGGAPGQTKVSAISSINPSDIETIDVLKDASATAIYGSRGSNGVILITTKKGKKGKAVISYESFTGIQQATKFLKVLNLREFAKYTTDISKQLGTNIPYEFQNPEILGNGTNWQKEIFRQAQMQNHNLTISGGKDDTRYFTSLNYFKQDGIVINTDFQRIALRLNLETKVNDWLKIGNNITLANTKENIAFNDTEDGVINTAFTQSPNVPVRYSDGSYGGPDPNSGNPSVSNPVALALNKGNSLTRYKIVGSIFGELKISKSLVFKSVLGYDFNTANSVVFYPEIKIGDATQSSFGFRGQNQNFSYTFQNYFTYTKDFGEHNIVFLLGQEANRSDYEGINGTRNNFVSNDVTTLNLGDAKTATNNNFQGRNSISSYYTRLNYSYKSKYLLTATLRQDASSKFGLGFKTGYFPSFSLAWVVSNETFFQPLKNIINQLKIRGGYGKVGNQNIANGTYGANIISFATPYGTGFAQENIQNPAVTWEKTISSNLGIDLSFLKDAISLNLDFYKKISSDFLFNEPVPAYLGSNPQQGNLGLAAKVVNIGDIENKGFDISLNTRNISNKNFSWTSSFIFSKFTNILTSFGDNNSAVFRIFQFNKTLTKTNVGAPVGQFYGYQVAGIYTSAEDIANSPTPDAKDITSVGVGDLKFKDINGDGKITIDDRTNIGNPLPDFTYSVANNFNYKNVDLGISIIGSQGNKIYNWSRRLTESLGAIGGPYSNQSPVVLDRFIPGNPVLGIPNQNENTGIPRYANGDPNGNIRVSDRFVEDGSYLRIQNITLGYSINSKFLDKTNFFTKIRLYTTVQNVYTFTKYSGLDPTVGSYSQDALLTGVDNGRYPVSRVFTFGLNLDF